MFCLWNAVILAVVSNVWTILAIENFHLIVLIENFEMALLFGFALFLDQFDALSRVMVSGSSSFGIETYLRLWRM